MPSRETYLLKFTLSMCILFSSHFASSCATNNAAMCSRSSIISPTTLYLFVCLSFSHSFAHFGSFQCGAVCCWCVAESARALSTSTTHSYFQYLPLYRTTLFLLWSKYFPEIMSSRTQCVGVYDRVVWY